MMTMMTTSCSTKTTMMMRTTSVLSTTKSNCRRRFALDSLRFCPSPRRGSIFHHHQRRNNAKTNEEEEVEESRVVIEKEDGPAVLKKTKHGKCVYLFSNGTSATPQVCSKNTNAYSRNAELDSIQIESLHPKRKRRDCKTRAMVRTVLSSILNEGKRRRKPSQRKVVDPSSLEFTLNEKGKPFFETVDDDDDDEFFCEFERGREPSENLNIQFSVSHFENVVAMAVTTDGRRVGIDWRSGEEKDERRVLEISKEVFRKGEVESD